MCFLPNAFFLGQEWVQRERCVGFPLSSSRQRDITPEIKMKYILQCVPVSVQRSPPEVRTEGACPGPGSPAPWAPASIWWLPCNPLFLFLPRTSSQPGQGRGQDFFLSSPPILLHWGRTGTSGLNSYIHTPHTHFFLCISLVHAVCTCPRGEHRAWSVTSEG